MLRETALRGSIVFGPEPGLEPILKKMAMELDSKPVKFALVRRMCLADKAMERIHSMRVPLDGMQAYADHITALEEFRNKPTPFFQLYKNGEVVELIVGADLPERISGWGSAFHAQWALHAKPGISGAVWVILSFEMLSEHRQRVPFVAFPRCCDS
jgi:hypothetical protein